MSFTQGGNGQDGRHSRTLTSIPLSEADNRGESIGGLVRDATEQMSTLVRAEVELAKAEVTGEIKKGLQGSIFFILALVVLLYSSFFFFFFLAELLDKWMARWGAFLTVFGLMIVAVLALAGLGYLKVKKLRAPEKTIESLKEAKTVLPSGFGAPGAHEAGASPQLDKYRG
ncbi:phage holin family protein [Nocardia uniformis]|uniref:Phage holin family protein n=1 Tax=Nocardia uniformis TaxID=53432 RepID=A0A849C3S2_9NOCA|nr:phage holin family protein [Nocardia uniformis]NNH73363.1 phage holin family protein [Nocardia uniformis]